MENVRPTPRGTEHFEKDLVGAAMLGRLSIGAMARLDDIVFREHCSKFLH